MGKTGRRKRPVWFVRYSVSPWFCLVCFGHGGLVGWVMQYFYRQGEVMFCLAVS